MTPHSSLRRHQWRPRHVTGPAATAVVLAAVGALAGCSPDSPAAPSPATSSASASTSPVPTATTAQGQAYEAAEKSYRTFLDSWSAANVNFDSTALNEDVATPDLLKALREDLEKFKPQAEKGVTGRFTQDIKSIKGVSYEPGVRVVLRVCAVTNSRFIQDGKDVTRSSPNGPFAPVNRTPRSNDIQFATADGGGSWQVAYFVLDPNMGKPC